MARKLRILFDRRLYAFSTFGTKPIFSTHLSNTALMSSSSPAGAGTPRAETWSGWGMGAVLFIPARRPGSLRVRRVLGVEDLLHLGEMREGGVLVVLPAARRPLGDVGRHDVEFLPARIGQYQGLAGALEVVEVVERLGHRVGGHQHAVVAEHDPPVVAEHPRQALAFFVVVGDAAE